MCRAPQTDSVHSDSEVVVPDMAGKTVERILRGYNPNLKPIGTVVVNTGLLRISFTNIDPAGGNFEAVFWLTLGWTDDRLSWNPEVYADAVTLPYRSIWVPPYFFDLAEQLRDTLYVSLATINSSGYVEWQLNRKGTFMCQGSLHLYPFDTSVCQVPLYTAHSGINLTDSYGVEISDDDEQYIACEKKRPHPMGPPGAHDL